jgi:hypothetical protein
VNAFWGISPLNRHFQPWNLGLKNRRREPAVLLLKFIRPVPRCAALRFVSSRFGYGAERSGVTLRGSLAVVADGLDGAAFEGFRAQGGFLLGRRLFLDVGVAPLVVAREERGRRLSAQVAVDALLVNVEFASDVGFPFVCFVCHK